jgi:hypothetical protein
MAESDDKQPADVIPFIRAIQGTIGEELRKMYGEFVSEKLPDDIAVLARHLAAKLAKEKDKV